MGDSGNGPELQVKYSVNGIEQVKQANAEVIDSTKKVDNQVKQSGSSFEKYRDILGKVSAFAGGAFVTAALAAGKAIYAANEQVSALDKSMRVSSGSMQNYERNQRGLQEVADKYQKSIFLIAEGYNTLSRETRNTINEGVRTQQMMDDLTVVSGKVGYAVSDTTDHLGSFIDKMKQGTVDSTGLSDELDKRLYEAFVKVAEGMNLTAGELNEVLKESDEAVGTVLPKLTAELKNALGDVPQQDANDLGEKIQFAYSKLTLLLAGLYKTSGAKTVFSKAAEDVGSYFDVLNKVNELHGADATVSAAIRMGAVGLVNTASRLGGGKGFDLQSDPYGARTQIEAEWQRGALAKSGFLGAKEYVSPYESAKKEFDILTKAAEDRAEAEEKANQKIVAAMKRAAAERKRAMDEITRQEIEASNDRIRDGLLQAERTVREHYANRPSSNISKQFLTNTGYDRKFNDSSMTKSHEEFTNPVSMGGGFNYDHIIAQINKMNDAWGQNFVAVSKATLAVNDLDIATEKLNDHYKEAITSMAEGGAVDTLSSLAGGLGEIAVGTGGIEDVGNKVANAFGGMIQQIGQATIAYGITKSGLEKALAATFATPGGGAAAIAIGVAAVAAGAALKAAANKSQSQAMSRMWDGGTVDPIGTDRIPVMLTPGEMVFPIREQMQLSALIRRTNTGSINSPAVGVGAAGGTSHVAVSVKGELLGSTIHLANSRAGLEENYYR